MPNRNRAKGDYFERRTRDALEADGWLVVRAAGSLGPADLVAMREGVTWLVSCKTNGYLDRKETISLNDAGHKAGATAILAWRKRPGMVHLYIVTRHGKQALEPMRMPPRIRRPKAQTLPVDPDQMTIYDVLDE